MATSLWSLEGGKLRLNFHAGQAEAWNCTRRYVFVLAGTQAGKTSWGPWWLWREIRNTAQAEGGTNDYMAVTASYDLFKLKMLPVLREAFEHVLNIGRYWSGDRIIELRDPATGRFWARFADDAMWGRIILRSAVGGGGLESMTARGAWLDECGQDGFTLETWEAVLRRLSLCQGRALGTTTIYNLGWLQNEIWKPWLAGDPTIGIVQFASIINPRFPQEEYERARARMPTDRFQMFYHGQFGRPAGMVYDCFDDDRNIVAPFDVPPQWERTVGVDFGGANTSTVWLAHNPDTNVCYVYRETLEGGLSTSDHCSKALASGRAENVTLWLGGAPSETQQRADWVEAGVPIIQPPVSDLEAGIMRVYGLLKTRQMRIFSSCRGVLDEIGRYKRKLDASGQPMEEIADKRKFHRLDALRYACTGIGAGKVEYSPSIYH